MEYSPYDVAVFLLACDLTHADELVTIHSIWAGNSIPIQYRQDEILFKRHIYWELSKFDGLMSDIEALNILLKDTEHALDMNGTVNEQGIIERYFKVIKLELTYAEGREFCKIKLRRLLKKFGYKRRSAQLVATIKSTLQTLELKTYVKGYVLCDIAEIGIDEMIMIRLK